ncbi:MAG: sulfatase [Leptospiraceae bacterium]|nr:sulfatase [Leptospiraceae bacterium]
MKPNFIQLILIFFALFLFSCEEKQELPKVVKPIDLTRELRSAKTDNFIFNEKTELVSHWKKNPGRFSGLDVSKKWHNTQATFNTDTKFYINHSQDSIFLSPNASVEFQVSAGIYTLRFDAGILAEKSDKAGRLVVEIDGVINPENSILLENVESWASYERIIRVNQKVKFIWNSNNSYAFIAHPIITPSEYKNTKPNIILFVIDALRSDSLSYTGFRFPTSPNIDELAKDSILFPKAFVNANWTKPSMLSMFYSDYASNLGIGNIGFDVTPNQKKIFYNPKRKNLVNTLRDNSYYTASVMNNVFFLDYTGVGFDLGFHELIQVGKDIDDTKKIADETIDFLNRNKHFPFFLHVNFNTPHGSYVPPTRVMKELQQETDPAVWNKENPTLRRYYGEIRYADEELGRILSGLKTKKIYDETIIILTADHGELLSDYHTFEANGVYGVKYGHGMTHFDEEIQVPFIIKPSKVLGSKILPNKFNKPVSLLSITPTVLGLSNIQYQKNDFKGVDYSRVLFGESFIAEESIFTEGRLSESVRTEDYKYVRFYPSYTNSQLSGRHLQDKELEEIYDLKNDKNEKNLIKDTVLIEKARAELDKHALTTNSFHIVFPKKNSNEVYSGTMEVDGAIYRVRNQKEFGIQIQSKRNFSFSFSGNNMPRELIIDTIHPSFDFTLSVYLNQNPEKYRIGKWGILNQNSIVTNSQILISQTTPENLDNLDKPWIYNDAKLTGEKELRGSSDMGDEVRQILKSWGYIHE